MGEAKQRGKRLQQFLQKHPTCCFCGGKVAATTIEHAPPIVFFVDRLRPSTHEFPACERCNVGSRSQDMMAAFTSIMMASAVNPLPKGYVDKIISGAVNNYPDAMACFERNADELVVKNGLARRAVSVKTHGELYRRWLNPWAVRQGLALWYLYTRKPLPEEGRVCVRWFSNVEMWTNASLQRVFELMPNTGMLESGRNNSAGQYEYKFAIDEDMIAGNFNIALHQSALVAITIDYVGDLNLAEGEWPMYKTNSVDGITLIGKQV